MIVKFMFIKMVVGNIINNLGTRATYTQQHRSAQRPQLSVDGPDFVVVVMCS